MTKGSEESSETVRVAETEEPGFGDWPLLRHSLQLVNGHCKVMMYWIARTQRWIKLWIIPDCTVDDVKRTGRCQSSAWPLFDDTWRVLACDNCNRRYTKMLLICQ